MWSVVQAFSFHLLPLLPAILTALVVFCTTYVFLRRRKNSSSTYGFLRSLLVSVLAYGLFQSVILFRDGRENCLYKADLVGDEENQQRLLSSYDSLVDRLHAIREEIKATPASEISSKVSMRSVECIHFNNLLLGAGASPFVAYSHFLASLNWLRLHNNIPSLEMTTELFAVCSGSRVPRYS